MSAALREGEKNSNIAHSESDLSFSSADFLDDDYLNDADLTPVTPEEYQNALNALEATQESLGHHRPQDGDASPPQESTHGNVISPTDLGSSSQAQGLDDRRHSFDGVFPHNLLTQKQHAEAAPSVPQVSAARPPIPHTVQSRASGSGTGTRSEASKRRFWKQVLEKFDERLYPYSCFLLFKRPGHNMKGDSLCMKCEFLVTGFKPNELREHLMCCPKLPLNIRRRIWRKSKSSRRPPLLHDPPKEHTVASLKQLFGSCDYTVDENGNDVDYETEPASSLHGQVRPMKRRKVEPRSIHACTEGEAQRISKKILAFIVSKCLPFTTVKREERFTGSFQEKMEEARPGYVSHIPSATKLSTTMLNSMYDDVKRRVQNSMRVMLRSGYATVMFDGRRDINSAPVINVLARVIGESRESARTFFLGMIYSGVTSCTAQRYVEIVEEIMEEYGGMDRVAAVVTDNTRACKNARETLAKKYGKLVASQDQAHIADLLMKDIGEIEWMESTLATLTPIPSILRTFAKLNQRLRELMEDYNRSVTGDSRLDLSGYNEVVPCESAMPVDDPDQYEAYPDREERERHLRAQQRAVMNTAIMMKPVSNVPQQSNFRW